MEFCHTYSFLFIFRPSVDLYFYVIGASGENELMLQSVLQCLFDSLNILLRKDVEKKTVFQNLGNYSKRKDKIQSKNKIENNPKNLIQKYPKNRNVINIYAFEGI